MEKLQPIKVAKTNKKFPYWIRKAIKVRSLGCEVGVAIMRNGDLIGFDFGALYSYKQAKQIRKSCGFQEFVYVGQSMGDNGWEGVRTWRD